MLRNAFWDFDDSANPPATTNWTDAQTVVYFSMARASCFMRPLLELASCMNDPDRMVTIPGGHDTVPSDRSEQENTTLVVACDAVGILGLADCVNLFNLSEPDEALMERCTLDLDLSNSNINDHLDMEEYTDFLSRFNLCQNDKTWLSAMERATFLSFADCDFHNCLLDLPVEPRAKLWSFCLTSASGAIHCEQPDDRLSIIGTRGECLAHADANSDGVLNWIEYEEYVLQQCAGRLGMNDIETSTTASPNSHYILEQARHRFQGFACRACLGLGFGFQCCLSASTSWDYEHGLNSLDYRQFEILNGTNPYTQYSLAEIICSETEALLHWNDCLTPPADVDQEHTETLPPQSDTSQNQDDSNSTPPPRTTSDGPSRLHQGYGLSSTFLNIVLGVVSYSFVVLVP